MFETSQICPNLIGFTRATSDTSVLDQHFSGQVSFVWHQPDVLDTTGIRSIFVRFVRVQSGSFGFSRVWPRFWLHPVRCPFWFIWTKSCVIRLFGPTCAALAPVGCVCAHSVSFGFFRLKRMYSKLVRLFAPNQVPIRLVWVQTDVCGSNRIWAGSIRCIWVQFCLFESSRMC